MCVCEIEQVCETERQYEIEIQTHKFNETM